MARSGPRISPARKDTFHLVTAGLSGGKGIGPSVAGHPRVFATFSAPSFGPVHNRPGGGRCRGGRLHADGDPARGTPLDPDRYDYRAAVPPQLVAILRQHLDTFGTAEDRRLFTNERGGVVGSSTYYRLWQKARALALPPAAVASPLVARLYDLRDSALATWLNSGGTRRRAASLRATAWRSC